MTINILNYLFLKNDQYHNVFHLREDRTGISLIDDIEVYFLELPKLDERSVPSEGGLINWLLFLKGADRRLYEARQKYLHDEDSMVEGAKSAGIIEGKLQVARNLLALGMDYAVVTKATGLSESEIKSIKL